VQQSKADTVKTVLMAALEQELKIGQIKSLTQAMRDAQGLQEKSARIDDILDACKKSRIEIHLKISPDASGGNSGFQRCRLKIVSATKQSS
jgi:predicted RNase H-related nuclease YkuK (DUF458 family)